MKQTGLLYTAMLAICAFAMITSSSCKKEPQNSSITYVNDTYTPISITVNGNTQTIPVNGSVTYTGNQGSAVTVSASTSGTFGLPYAWNYTENFPSSSTTASETLDIDPSYFYLKVINTYTYSTTALEVNVGLTTQTTENMTIPDDGNTYGVGYYYAFADTQVKPYYTDLTYWISPTLSIPNTINAEYILSLQ